MISSILKRGTAFDFTLDSDPDEIKTIFNLTRAELQRQTIYQHEQYELMMGKTDAKNSTEIGKRKADLTIAFVLEHLNSMKNVEAEGDELTDKAKLETLLRETLDDDQLFDLVAAIQNGPGALDRMAVKAMARAEARAKNG